MNASCGVYNLIENMTLQQTIFLLLSIRLISKEEEWRETESQTIYLEILIANSLNSPSRADKEWRRSMMWASTGAMWNGERLHIHSSA